MLKFRLGRRTHGPEWEEENAERIVKFGEYVFRLLYHSTLSVCAVMYFKDKPWWDVYNGGTGPCRLTNPIVKEIMIQYKHQIDVVEISTDDFPEVAERANVLSIPTIQLYYGGKVMDTIVGCVSKNVLGRAVDKVLEDNGLLIEE
jgi:thioredoxin 1